MGFWGKATKDVAPGASCTLTPEGLPPYDKGHTTAKAARWGTEKKGVKEQSFLVLFPCSLRNVEIAIQFHMWNDTLKVHIVSLMRKNKIGR
ncbi:hypothetical protein BREVNS_1270 [Brevinematales bacterium NS]|nr:hypothetical protein BREVNS_1270 [Brevinematales bacterium NS]